MEREIYEAGRIVRVSEHAGDGADRCPQCPLSRPAPETARREGPSSRFHSWIAGIDRWACAGAPARRGVGPHAGPHRRWRRPYRWMIGVAVRRPSSGGSEPGSCDLAGMGPRSARRTSGPAGASPSKAGNRCRTRMRARRPEPCAPAGDQTKCWPPLMVSVEPFTKPASSLARYSTAWAISLASPRRPVGMVEMILLRISSGTAITISVAM